MDLVAAKLHIAYYNFDVLCEIFKLLLNLFIIVKTHLANKTSSIIIFHAGLHGEGALNNRKILGTEKRVFLIPCSVHRLLAKSYYPVFFWILCRKLGQPN